MAMEGPAVGADGRGEGIARADSARTGAAAHRDEGTRGVGEPWLLFRHRERPIVGLHESTMSCRRGMPINLRCFGQRWKHGTLNTIIGLVLNSMALGVKASCLEGEKRL